MIKTTLWRPDTCTCEIEYQWDDSQPDVSRVHTIKNIVKACDAHKGLTKENAFTSVLDENKRKNKFLSEAVNSIPALAQDQINDDGTTSKTLKKSVKFEFSFDQNRNLVANFSGVTLTPQQKTSLQGIADSKFGSNKIQIN